MLKKSNSWMSKCQIQCVLKVYCLLTKTESSLFELGEHAGSFWKSVMVKPRGGKTLSPQLFPTCLHDDDGLEIFCHSFKMFRGIFGPY